MNIYVGNLPYKTVKEDLQNAFEEFGEVESVDIIVDRRSGRSRGYGFVSMPNEGEAKAAVETLNGSEMDGRNLRVDFSRPKQEGEQNDRPSNNNQNRKPTAQTSTSTEKKGGLLSKIKSFFS